MVFRTIRWTYVVFTWLMFAAVVVQFFLAGLGVFGGPGGFQAHVTLGYSLLFVTLIDLALAFAARLPRSVIGLTALLPALVLLQSVFIAVWHSGLPVVAALHVVNGLAIFSLAGLLAFWSLRRLASAKPIAMGAGAATPDQRMQSS